MPFHFSGSVLFFFYIQYFTHLCVYTCILKVMIFLYSQYSDTLAPQISYANANTNLPDTADMDAVTVFNIVRSFLDPTPLHLLFSPIISIKDFRRHSSPHKKCQSICKTFLHYLNVELLTDVRGWKVSSIGKVYRDLIRFVDSFQGSHRQSILIFNRRSDGGYVHMMLICIQLLCETMAVNETSCIH